MQKIDDNHLIAVTLTLNPVYARGYSDKKQYVIINDLCNRKFKQKRCTFITEYTKNNDLHIHGVIESKGRSVRSTIISINNTLRGCPEIGYRCLKEIDHLAGWIAYMEEDLNVTEDLLGFNPVVRDDLKYYLSHQAERLEKMYKEQRAEIDNFYTSIDLPHQKVDLVDTFLSFDA